MTAHPRAFICRSPCRSSALFALIRSRVIHRAAALPVDEHGGGLESGERAGTHPVGTVSVGKHLRNVTICGYVDLLEGRPGPVSKKIDFDRH